VSAWRDWRFRLGCAAFLLLLAGIVLPSMPVSRPIYDAIVVLDITGSMNVRDQTLDGAPATRLELEKRVTRRLLAALPCGSRLGVAIFVETRPFLLFEPVESCGNATPLDQEIAGIDWRMAWDGESHIAIGLHNAMLTAKALGADLIFMTDGQEVPPLWWTGAPNFDDVRGTAHGLIAGIGGLAFSPIPKFDFAGRQIGTWKPGEIPSERTGLFHGREHLSAVDEPHLQSLARQSGLAYLHVTDPGALLDAFARAVPRRSRPSVVDIRVVPAALALVLMALRQARRFFFFEKKKQKTFVLWFWNRWERLGTASKNKSLFASFSSEKEDSF
jgi:mxaL protein